MVDWRMLSSASGKECGVERLPQIIPPSRLCSFSSCRLYFHRLVRSTRRSYWRSWQDDISWMRIQNPQACASRIRRCFRSPTCRTAPHDSMIWRTPHASTARLCDGWRDHFSSVVVPSTHDDFSSEFHCSMTLRFFELISDQHSSGVFDAPFSESELSRALSKCHHSAPGLDGLRYSTFQQHLPWWRAMLLDFFNLLLSWNVGADVCVCGLVDTLRLRQDTNAFCAFVDIRKAFDTSWVEATLVRLHQSGVTGGMWRTIANFLCGTLSQVRVRGDVSLSPLLFNLLVNSLAAAIRRASPGVRLVPSSDFQLTDQLYADDLVVLGESEADLQLALDAVTRWGRQWRFSFGVGPEKSAVMIHPFKAVVQSLSLSQLCRPIATLALSCPFPPLGRTRRYLVSRGHGLFVRNVWNGICRRLRTCAVGPGSKTLGTTSSRLARRDPCAAVLCELALPDSLRVATGRSLSLFGRLHTLSSGGRSPIPASVFVLSQHVPGTWAHWCFSLLQHHAVGSLGYHGVGVGCSPLVIRRWLHHVVFPVLDRAWVQCLARALAITGVRFSPGSVRPFALDLSIYNSDVDPGLVRWWGLARHGHDPCPGGRPARHRGGEVACLFCPSTFGDLTHCLTSCPAFEDVRVQWCIAVHIAPAEVSTSAQHSWCLIQLTLRTRVPQYELMYVSWDRCVPEFLNAVLCLHDGLSASLCITCF